MQTVYCCKVCKKIIYRNYIFFTLNGLCEEIRDASRTDESHQISSWSEQSGGVITLRNGYEGCCSFQEVN